MDRHQGDVLQALTRGGVSRMAGALAHRLGESGSVSSRAQLAARELARGAILLHWRIAQKRGDTLPKRTSRVATPFGPIQRCGTCGRLTKHPIHHPDHCPRRGR